MVIPASKSYHSFCRLYFGSHSKIGTKYSNVFFVFIKPFGSCDIGLNGSSGKKVSLHFDLNFTTKLLGAEKFTPCPFGDEEELVLSLSMVTKEKKKQLCMNTHNKQARGKISISPLCFCSFFWIIYILFSVFSVLCRELESMVVLYIEG